MSSPGPPEEPQVSSTDAFALAFEKALQNSENEESLKSAVFGNTRNRMMNSIDMGKPQPPAPIQPSQNDQPQEKSSVVGAFRAKMELARLAREAAKFNSQNAS